MGKAIGRKSRPGRGNTAFPCRDDFIPYLRKMRSTPVIFLLIFVTLSVACTEGGLAEPIPLPVLSQATELPTATSPPVATPLPPATMSPTLSAPEPATELPPATVLPTPTRVLPATSLPPVDEIPTAEPAPTAPVLPTVAPELDLTLPLVSIGPATWTVELAITTEEQIQGLSGRETLPQGTGMLFIYDSDRHLAFWMPDMYFPLDMVWIDSSCQMVDVTLNAPIPLPGQSRADLPRFSPQSPARFVLEINAGEFEGYGISLGDQVAFQGALQGQYGC